MKSPLKLFFDENLGKPIVDSLAKLLSFHDPAPEVVYIKDHMGKYGAKDTEWIPSLAADDWLVITADQGKGKGPKLPEVCRAYGVRHVMFSGKLHNRAHFEKVRAILVVWPGLLEATRASKGARFKLQLSQTLPVLRRA